MYPHRLSMIKAFETMIEHGTLKESHHEYVENWIIISLYILIIILSIFFEYIVEWMEHFLQHNKLNSLVKLLRTACKELTILGFISLTLFCCIRTGLVQDINDRYFGLSKTQTAALREAEEKGEAIAPPTHLTEIFEAVHILIFAVMCSFIVETAILSILGYQTMKKFTYLDEKTEEDIRNDLKSSRREDRQHERHIDEALEYWGTRQRFLNPPLPVMPHPRPREAGYQQFSFSHYLISSFSDVLVGMIELPPSILLLILLIVALLRPALDLHAQEVIIYMIFLSFTLLFVTIAIWFRVKRIDDDIIPKPSNLRTFFEKHGGSQEKTQALACEIDERPLASQRFFPKKILANRSASLFPFSTPIYFHRLLQITLFFHAAYVSVLVTCIFSGAHGSQHLWWINGLWSYPLTLLPFFFSLFFWTKILPCYSKVVNIDFLASFETIRAVELQQDKDALNRDFRYLDFMMHQAEKAEQGKAVQIQRLLALFESLNDEAKESIKDTFKALAFHKDRFPHQVISGVVSKDAIGEMLRCLKFVPSSQKDARIFADEWFSTLDVNRTGYLNFDSFKVLVMLLGRLGIDRKDLKEFQQQRLKKLFETLDTNHDNKISMKELKETMSGMDPPLSDREAEALLRRISPAGGEITFQQLYDWSQKTQIRSSLTVIAA